MFLYILLEFQSSIDYRMPVRLLFYMSELIKSYTENNSEEYGKKNKNFLIPPIVPIVLYNGSETWDVPTEFRSIIKNQDLFDNSLLNFKYLLFDINRLNKEELLNNKSISSMIFLLDRKMKPKEFIETIISIEPNFDNLEKGNKEGMISWLSNSFEPKLAKMAVNILLKKDGDKMTFNNANLWTEYGVECKNLGIQEGLTKGLQEGLTKGIQEGLIKGKIECKIEDIFEELRTLGEIPKELEELILKQDKLETLKMWFKIVLKCESIGEFVEKIKV